MAKFKLEKEIGELVGFYMNYDSASMEIDEQSGTTLDVSDMNGDRVVYTGTGFAFDGEEATGGTIKKVEFFNGNGDLLLTISSASYKLTDILISGVQFNFQLFEKGNDTFTGSSVGDWIMYGANEGNDKIFGLGGNDYILGSDGKNTYDGGTGDADVLTWSMIAYEAGMKGVKVDLAKGEAINPWGKTDTIKNIEDVRGTKFADTFKGTSKDEHFGGLEGNDTFTGGKGKDRFDFTGGMGKDKITDWDDGDSIELAGLGVSTFNQVKALMEQKGKNIVINFGDGDMLTFLNASKADFSKSDFTLYEF